MSEDRRIWPRGLEWFLALLLLAPASFLIGELRGGQRALENAEAVRDTMYTFMTDTIFQDRPVYVDRVQVRTEYIPVTDTIRIRDTLVVEVPVEQLVYRDSLYRAWVSGYRPSLDSIQIFQQTKIVEVTRTVQERPKHWGVGLTAGYGLSFDGSAARASPQLSLGVTYNLLTW